MESITQLIEDMLVEDTFSAKAVEGIKALRDKAAQMEAANEKLTKAYSDLDQGATILKNNISKLSEEVRQYSEREAALVEREKLINDLEKEKECAVASEHAYKYAMEIVFKPSQTRRDVSTSRIKGYMSGPQGGGDVDLGEVSRNETESEE